MWSWHWHRTEVPVGKHKNQWGKSINLLPSLASVFVFQVAFETVLNYCKYKAQFCLSLGQPVEWEVLLDCKLYLIDKLPAEKWLYFEICNLKCGEWFSNHWCWESLPVFSITATGEEKENLTAQALALSLLYKFVTPLTSMVVTKPEENDNEEGIADKPTEGIDIFTTVLYLRS